VVNINFLLKENNITFLKKIPQICKTISYMAILNSLQKVIEFLSTAGTATEIKVQCCPPKMQNRQVSSGYKSSPSLHFHG